MAESIINCEDLSGADVVLLSANYDKTSSFGKGADKGPEAIINCLQNQIEFYERFTKTEPCCKYRIAHHDLGNLNNLEPEEMVNIVAKEFEKYYKEKKFVIMLGGEHSVSNGPFRIISSQNPQEITVLHIDAHADLREDDSDCSSEPKGKYAHSCVMKRAYDAGLKTVQVGIRAYSKEEHEFIKKNKLAVFEWGKKEIKEIPTADEIIKAIKTDKVYLTIDVDGIDPSHMPATGTPVQGGLEWHYMLRLLEKLFEKKNVVAADIVEVAPKANDKLTEYGAAQICYNLIAYKMLNKK